MTEKTEASIELLKIIINKLELKSVNVLGRENRNYGFNTELFDHFNINAYGIRNVYVCRYLV